MFALEGDMDPLMAPVDRAPALIEFENPIADIENPFVYYNPLVAPVAIPIKFGLNYSTSD